MVQRLCGSEGSSDGGYLQFEVPQSKNGGASMVSKKPQKGQGTSIQSGAFWSQEFAWLPKTVLRAGPRRALSLVTLHPQAPLGDPAGVRKEARRL